MISTDLVVSLLTIAASGVTAAVVTFRLSARREDMQFRRRQLEVTYRAFGRFTTQLGVAWLPVISVMAGRLDYNQALGMINAKPVENEPRALEELQMLVAIYFPEFDPLLDELLSIRDRANEVMHVHKERYRSIGPARRRRTANARFVGGARRP